MRTRTELDRADVEDAADRDQRHDRGVDGAHQRLVHRQVGGLRVGLPGASEVAGVLADLVEDHDRVVEREAEDRQQAGHRGRADLEAGQGVDPDRDDHVVGERHERGQRHLPLPEVGPDEEHHQHQEDAQAQQCPLGDRLAPARADLRLGDVVGGVGARRRDDGVDDLGALRAVDRLGLHQDGLGARGGHHRSGGVASMSVPATARRSSSAVSWLTWLAGSETRYSAPPVNSMP